MKTPQMDRAVFALADVVGCFALTLFALSAAIVVVVLIVGLLT